VDGFRSARLAVGKLQPASRVEKPVKDDPNLHSSLLHRSRASLRASCDEQSYPMARKEGTMNNIASVVEPVEEQTVEPVEEVDDGEPNTFDMDEAIDHMNSLVEFHDRMLGSRVLILKGIAQRSSHLPAVLRAFAQELGQMVKWAEENHDNF
jgi:hypothetical protein